MTRTILTSNYLDDLIYLQAVFIAQCDRCTLGHVVRCEPDPTGCNWRFSQPPTQDAARCMVALDSFIAQLKAQYNLAFEIDLLI